MNNQAAQSIEASVTTAVEVINNRVELIVVNPELFQNDLVEAGIQLSPSVVISAFNTGGDLPDSLPGMPTEGCPGPYWIITELETLVTIPFHPFLNRFPQLTPLDPAAKFH